MLDDLIADRRNEPLRVEAVKKADDWNDCACGGQDARIPRLERNGRPVDYQLSCLGYDFAFEVNEGEYAEAKVTLAAIESRAAEILAEMESK